MIPADAARSVVAAGKARSVRRSESSTAIATSGAPRSMEPPITAVAESAPASPSLARSRARSAPRNAISSETAMPPATTPTEASSHLRRARQAGTSSLIKNSPDKTMRLTPTEYAVLGLLTWGEQSGYDLQKFAERSVGYFWTPAKSRIYATLPRLVEGGLVRRRDIVQSGRPNKQVYRLTKAGEEALRRWVAEEPLEPETSRNTLLIKLFFGDLAEPEEVLRHVRQRRAEAEQLRFMRCNAVYYGALDFRDLAERFSVDRTTLEPYEALTYLRRRGAAVPPMLIAKAGADEPAINGSIDRFVSAAREVGAPVELVTHPTGPHGFDVRARGVASRRIIRRTLAFFRERLRGSFALAARRPRPLRLLEPCVTRAERRGIVRFPASDRTRLIGVLLGSGPNAVVLAHQGGGGAPGDLCAWISYARRLRAAGYRVFVFDHRAHGSSGVPSAVQRYTAVDFDVVAAVRLVRARGARRVVLGGASLGGAAVLGGAARLLKPVDGVFTIGGTHTFGVVDVRGALRKLTIPLLFVAAEEDGGGQLAQEAREMYEWSISPAKRVEVFPGTAHGAPQLRDPVVRQLVDGWIREHVTSSG